MRGEPETLDLEFLLDNSQRTLVAALHELKAPLSLIKMYGAQLDGGSLSLEDQKKYTSRLLLTAEQMLQLTTGLIEGQCLSGNQMPLEPVNTKITCEEVLHQLSPAARELEQRLEFRPGSQSSIAVGNATMLRNVVFNLVFNALKHTPAGSDITLSTVNKAEKARIHVLDTGPGFDKRTIAYVNRGVDGRFQAAADRPGSGLGLAIAKQLTMAMHGSLQLKASVTGGYCILSLPASRQLALAL